MIDLFCSIARCDPHWTARYGEKKLIKVEKLKARGGDLQLRHKIDYFFRAEIDKGESDKFLLSI